MRGDLPKVSTGDAKSGTIEKDRIHSRLDLMPHDTILLTSDDYCFFLKALDDKRKPSNRSRAAAKRYRSRRRKDVRYRVDS